MIFSFALQVGAELRAARGDAHEALALLRESLLVYGDDAPALSILRLTALAAAAIARLGNPENAAVLTGAAIGGQLAAMLPFVLGNSPDAFGATVEELTRTLGTDTYTALAARGAAMPSDELARFVRRAVDEALVPFDG